MKRAVMLLAAWALLLSLLSANAEAADVCASPVDYRPLPERLASKNAGGIGGTGRSASSDTGIGGIGGTGRAIAPGDGGIGGTGIVGTITGFASICVNGVEVHYEDSVPVSENGKPAKASGLAIGQLVVVEAGTSARGLEARRIAVVHALEGPVTRAANDVNGLEVMGARVSLAAPATSNQVSDLKAGDWVQVSGHPAADGGVVASRIARIKEQPEATVNGRAAPDSRRVGGVAVDRRTTGDLMLRGKWDGKQLRVRESRPAAGSVWTSRPSQVIIETRVRQSDGKQIGTGRADVDAVLRSRGRDDQLKTGTLIRVTARIDSDGKLRPIRVERAERDRREHSGTNNATGEPAADGRGDKAKDGAERGEKDQKEPKGQKEPKDQKDQDRNESRAAKDIISSGKTEKPARESGSETKNPERTERDQAARPEHTERIESERPERRERAERRERPERPERFRRDD